MPFAGAVLMVWRKLVARIVGGRRMTRTGPALFKGLSLNRDESDGRESNGGYEDDEGVGVEIGAGLGGHARVVTL